MMGCFQRIIAYSLLAIVFLLVFPDRGVAADANLRRIRLPEGFSISSYARGAVPLARSLVLSEDENGGATIVYVSTRKDSKVYALVDKNSDGIVDASHTLIDDIDTPNGIAWKNGSLFVAEISKVWRYDDADKFALQGKKLPKPVLVSDAFPSDKSHGWKYIAFGPDGKLYVPVGAPCNICEMEDVGDIAYGTINRMNADGTELEVYARGIRNTVGFAWHPDTGKLYFTDNGRDLLGDNLPDDELNLISKPGLHFGYPYCHTEGEGDPYERDVGPGKPLRDPFLGDKVDEKCTDEKAFQEPLQALGPHVAALGMRFYTGDMFPKEYQNSIFIATRGSWNRSKRIGYNVVRAKLSKDGKKVVEFEVFADGWLNRDTEEASGRPVDVLVLPDGSLLVSDDQAGDVYRITYSEKDASDPSVLRKQD